MSASTRPNQYTEQSVVSASDGAGTAGIDFGFNARQLVVANDKASSVYLTLTGSSGSTGGHEIKAGESLSLAGILCRYMGLASTATTTGTSVRVLAVGGE